MKLEAGKFYRTRDGRKVYIAAVGCPLKNAKYDCIGWVECQFESYPESWKAEGIFQSGCQTHTLDLIAPWIDPPWDYTPSPGEWVFELDGGQGYPARLPTQGAIDEKKAAGVLFAKMNQPPTPPGA